MALGKARDGLTLRQMLHLNRVAELPLTHAGPQRVKQMRKGNYRIIGSPFAKQWKSKDNNTIHAGYKFRMQSVEPTSSGFRPPRTHECWIMIRDPEQQTKNVSDTGVNLVFQCSCEFWLYVCEYALAKRWRASWIRLGNGAPPTTTNGGQVPLTCKHLHVALTHCLKTKI